MGEIDDMIDLEQIPDQALGEIVNERKHQDEKWGESNHDDLLWCAILMEEIGEVAKRLVENPSPDELDFDHEIVQVAAVAMAWRECRLRNIGETLPGLIGTSPTGE